MPFTLTIIFGGLCMLYEHEDPDPAKGGLFALMPDMSMPGMKHVPLMLYNGQAEGEKDPVLRSAKLFGKSVDLRGLGRNSSCAKQGFDPKFVPVSALGQAGVSPDLVTEEMPVQGLAARIALDLGHRVCPFGDPGELKFGEPPNQQSRTVVGLSYVQMQIPDVVPSLRIAGKVLSPVGGQLALAFVNLLGGVLHPPCVPHKPDEEQPHFQAYYWLLGKSDGPKARVVIQTDCPRPREAAAGSVTIATLDELAQVFPNWDARWIDPHQCTVTYGCPPESLDC